MKKIAIGLAILRWRVRSVPSCSLGPACTMWRQPGGIGRSPTGSCISRCAIRSRPSRCRSASHRRLTTWRWSGWGWGIIRVAARRAMVLRLRWQPDYRENAALSPLASGKPSRPGRTEELFWIVKHGIKYAGMPGWVAQSRDDEVWTVVAALRRLPDMSREEYRRLAMGDAGGTSRGATGEGLLTVCARCHGDDGAANGHVPRLAGQKQAYLEHALRSYASGERSSGIMRAGRRRTERTGDPRSGVLLRGTAGRAGFRRTA